MSNTITLTRKTTLVLISIMLDILKAYFKQHKTLTYSEDRNKSLIDIQPSYLWSPEITQKRPGIYIKREPLNFGGPRGMNDVHTVVGPTGQITYSLEAQVIWTIYCISPQPGGVEEIAMDVAEVLIAYSPIIKKDNMFERFRVQSIGAVGKMEDAKDHWMIPVQVAASFSEQWPLKPEALPITDIILKPIVTL